MKKHGKAITLVAVGLVAGLILGSIGIASAAPVTDPATDEPMGYGARIGWAIRDSGARMVDILAEATGLDVADIHDRRVEGESIADIAEAEGVDPSTVTGSALEARKQILDEKVADGTIDKEQADLMLERMTERVSERVDSTETGPFGNGRGDQGRGGRGQGMGGQGGGACGQGAGGPGGGAGACDGSCTVTE